MITKERKRNRKRGANYNFNNGNTKSNTGQQGKKGGGGNNNGLQDDSSYRCEYCGEKNIGARDKCWKCQQVKTKLRTQNKPLKPVDRIYFHSDIYEEELNKAVEDQIEAITLGEVQAREEYFITTVTGFQMGTGTLDDNLDYLGMLALPMDIIFEREGRKERESKVRLQRKVKREDERVKQKTGKIKFEDVRQKKRET